MIKKLGALILAFAIIVCGFVNKAPEQVVLAETNHFGGYYETYDGRGVLEACETVGAVASAVITGTDKIGGNLSENVSVTVDGASVTINQLSQTLADSMVLGNYYTLTINGNKSIDFRYVTKAISTKEDVAILNLTSATEAITGYYVLANNIILEQGEENVHDVNGDEKGLGISYLVPGFRGTFDGQGYNIDFWTDEAGFFGCIGKGALITNVGFVNVKVTKQGEHPVIASGSSISAGSPATIQSVYVRMADGNLPKGAIMTTGSIPLKLKNVVLEFPGANVDHNSAGLSSGALWGADYGWWVANGKEMKEVKDPLNYKDVYIIGKMPAMHYKASNPFNKKGFFVREDGTLSRTWMEGYAENEGVEEDIYNGEKVYKGVRKYNTLALLADDETNDYSTFNNEYWGVAEYGIPVWKNGVEDNFDLFLETYGQKTSAAFYLERGGIETATIGFGLGGIAVDGVPLTFEFIKGQEFVSIDSNTGVVSAVADGMAQFFVRCSYNGKDFEKKYTVYVTTKEGYTPEEPDNPTGGCGTFIIDGGSIGGGLLMILSASLLLLLNKKKSKVF